MSDKVEVYYFFTNFGKFTLMESNQVLIYILSIVHESLRFAEAKHAGIVVLNIGLIVGLLSIHDNIEKGVLIGFLGSAISIFVSIVSQFSITHNEITDDREVEISNIYFFGHFSKISHMKFIGEILKNVQTKLSASYTVCLKDCFKRFPNQ